MYKYVAESWKNPYKYFDKMSLLLFEGKFMCACVRTRVQSTMSKQRLKILYKYLGNMSSLLFGVYFSLDGCYTVTGRFDIHDFAKYLRSSTLNKTK